MYQACQIAIKREEYHFGDRWGHKILTHHALRTDLETLRLTDEERAFLERKCPYLPQSYLDFLSSYRFRPDEQVQFDFVSTEKDKNGTEWGSFELEIEGKWVETILYEVRSTPLSARSSLSIAHRSNRAGAAYVDHFRGVLHARRYQVRLRRPVRYAQAAHGQNLRNGTAASPEVTSRLTLPAHALRASPRKGPPPLRSRLHPLRVRLAAAADLQSARHCHARLDQSERRVRERPEGQGRQAGGDEQLALCAEVRPRADRDGASESCCF